MRSFRIRGAIVDGLRSSDRPTRSHRRMVKRVYQEGLRASEVAERFQVNERRISQMRGAALGRISAQFDKSVLQRSHLLEAAC